MGAFFVPLYRKSIPHTFTEEKEMFGRRLEKKFVVSGTDEKDREKVLKIFGIDEYKAARAYGEEAAKEFPDCIITCFTALCTKHGRVAINEMRVYDIWNAGKNK